MGQGTGPLDGGWRTEDGNQNSNSNDRAVRRSRLRTASVNPPPSTVLRPPSTVLRQPCIVIAHIDLGSFFVAVERARKPELIGRALVIGGRPGSGGVVAAASREARRTGIRPGMPLAQASLRCPDAIFLGGAVDAYLAASARVDEVLRRESP